MHSVHLVAVFKLTSISIVLRYVTFCHSLLVRSAGLLEVFGRVSLGKKVSDFE